MARGAGGDSDGRRPGRPATTRSTDGRRVQPWRWYKLITREMGRAAAATGSAAFFVLAPGVVAGFVPWWLTGWRFQDPLPYWAPLRLVGTLLLVAGLAVLVRAFAQFVAEGVGTPAPVAPTERLVVGGLYRYVRNPMYLAVLATILGQAL